MPKVSSAPLAAAAVLFFAAGMQSATAAYQPTSWSLKDMKTAIRALGYPKPHTKKLVCTRLAAGDYSAFRCRATYPHNVHARFVTEGVGEGGWLCGGKALAGCKLLRHGFATTAAITADGSMGAAADIASGGYLVNHDQTPYQRVHFCKKASASKWTCPYTVNKVTVTVTITFRTATGGYVVGGSTS